MRRSHPRSSQRATAVRRNTPILSPHEVNERPQLPPEVTEAFVLSNTSVQLYETLRGLESVRALSKSAGLEGLVATYGDLTGQLPRTLEQTVSAYATLVALTLLEPPNAEEALRRVDLSRLQWGAEIVDYFQRSARPTLITTATPGPARILSAPSSTASTFETMRSRVTSTTPTSGTGPPNYLSIRLTQESP